MTAKTSRLNKLVITQQLALLKEAKFVHIGDQTWHCFLTILRPLWPKRAELIKTFNFLKMFCCAKVHFVVPLIAPILDFVWPLPWLLKPGWFSHLHAYLLACSEPKRVMSCATPAFSTNRDVHCISVLTAGLSSGNLLGKQQIVDASSAAVRFNVRISGCPLDNERAMHSATPAGF